MEGKTAFLHDIEEEVYTPNGGAYGRPGAPAQPFSVSRGRQTILVVLFVFFVLSPMIWRQMTGTEEERADLFGMGRPDELELGAGNEVDWTPEEEKLREYAWESVEPHPSLGRMLAGLSRSERITRTWLLESRNVTQSGGGVGLGRTSSAAAVGMPLPTIPKARGLPRPLEGPGEFTGGDYHKYAELLREWQTHQQFVACDKGLWEDPYTKLHAEMLAGKRPPKLLEYYCEKGKNCGGFADRLLGITTTFMYAVLTGRAFSISWEHPVPFDLFFDAPHIDWSQRLPSTEVTTSATKSIYLDPELLDGRDDQSLYNTNAKDIDMIAEPMAVEWTKNNPRWIRFVTNRGMVLRSFFNEEMTARLDKVQLKASSAYSCLINYLMRPKPGPMALINLYTSYFSLPAVFSIAIQIRTGDYSLTNAEHDSLQTIDWYSAYFNCAAQVAKTYAHPSQKIIYYVVSDSEHLKAEAVKAYPDRVVLSGIEAVHAENNPGHSGVKDSADGIMGTIIESWILAGTDFQVLTEHSGFGKIPTWFRGKPGKTILVYNSFVSKPPQMDCSSDFALKSFSEMALGW